MCVHISVCVGTLVRMFAWAHLCVYAHIWKPVCMCVHIHVRMCTDLNQCGHVWICVHECPNLHTYVYVCTWKHVHTCACLCANVCERERSCARETWTYAIQRMMLEWSNQSLYTHTHTFFSTHVRIYARTYIPLQEGGVSVSSLWFPRDSCRS